MLGGVSSDTTQTHIVNSINSSPHPHLAYNFYGKNKRNRIEVFDIASMSYIPLPFVRESSSIVGLEQLLMQLQEFLLLLQSDQLHLHFVRLSDDEV